MSKIDWDKVTKRVMELTEKDYEFFGFKKRGLFQLGETRLHSGAKAEWKIDCDALTDSDIECAAYMLRQIVDRFDQVVGVPTGGLRLATAMEKYCAKPSPHVTRLLIVDDVLTTGVSIASFAADFLKVGDAQQIRGAVIFARGECPNWVKPLWRLGER